MNMNATAQMVTVSQGGKPRDDQPKPATEWTVYSVMKLRQKHWHEEDKNNAIAIAHNAAINAALAAERGKVKMLADALHFYRNHDDNGQTATDALRKIGK